ncbi:MAG: carboxypeptidase-like regulatory domain-containing protein [Bryobacteraceae bacterium]|nr:carboxypeptidase-like regulatory domain-containing protein [Bryobacteraceae bacterium]
MFATFPPLKRLLGASSALFAILLATPAGLFSQQLTGTLTGTVTDKSNSAIPRANVVLKNDTSGDIRRSVTGAEGFFSISGVFPGSYTLTVEASGFSKWERREVTFNPGDKRNISDIVLDIAATGTEVKVTSSVEEVTVVDSGEKALVVTQRQLQNVPVIGRSAAEFLKTLPGMSATGAGVTNRPGFTGEVMGINGNGEGGKQSALGTFSANGTRPSAMDIIADGAHISDPGCNCATPVNPNIDMVQEFKVLTSNFQAENQKGPVVINFVTKQGGTQFHGSGYFNARHFALNSNDAFFKQNGAPRPENRFLFPGFTVGGPVLIPKTRFNKNRDKLFFFAGLEFFRQRLDTGVLRAFVPTDAMLNGDFSDARLLGDNGVLARNNIGQASAFPQFGTGDNRMPYPNGRIPSTEIDRSGLAMLRLFPRPNADPAANQGFNYVRALPVEQNGFQSINRVDYSISDNTKLFVRYARQGELQLFPVQLWWRAGTTVPTPSPIRGQNRSDSITSSLTKVFTPTLTNEFVFGYTFVDFPNSYQDYNAMTRSANGFTQRGIFNQDDKIPAVFGWGGGVPTMASFGGFDPVLFATKHLYTINDNLTKVVDTHTLKTGFNYAYVRNAQPGNGNSNGSLTYANWHGASSGNALADLLTGRLDSYGESTKQIIRDIRFQEFSFFVQDSWRLKKNFTLEYGMRFQHLTPWTARNGIGIAAWVPGEYNNSPSRLGDLTGLSWNKRNSAIPLSGWGSRAFWYAPRVGFAWDINGSGKTVFRGGWGRFIYPNPQLGASQMDIPAGVLNAGIGGGLLLRDITNFRPSAVRTGVDAADPTDNRNPNTDSWSFSLSRRLPFRSLFEVSYVGNRSFNLLTPGGFQDINQVPIGAMRNDPDGDTNAYRPRLNYNNINVATFNAYQNYNGLQAVYSKQAGKLNMTAAYTYGKAMGIRGDDQGQIWNTLDLKANYGPLAYDRTHDFKVSYVYNVGDIVKGANKLVSGVANGWQISGLIQTWSGTNLQAAGSPSFGPNIFRSATDNRGVNGQLFFGTPAIQVQPQITCNPAANLKPGQYINGSCFAPTRLGQANGPGIFPYLRGPGFFNTDLSLYKRFKFTERQNLEFRFSGYNFINRANRSFVDGDPNLNLNFEARNTAAPRFGYADNFFGRRVIQMGVKYFF